MERAGKPEAAQPPFLPDPEAEEGDDKGCRHPGGHTDAITGREFRLPADPLPAIAGSARGLKHETGQGRAAEPFDE
jgi:hypothetical protein